MSAADFEDMGMWSESNQMAVKMWRHKATGVVFYQDHQRTRERKLPVYPFAQ